MEEKLASISAKDAVRYVCYGFRSVGLGEGAPAPEDLRKAKFGDESAVRGRECT